MNRRSFLMLAATVVAAPLLGLIYSGIFMETTEVRKVKNAIRHTCRPSNMEQCNASFRSLLQNAKEVDVIRHQLGSSHPAVVAARNGLDSRVKETRNRFGG